MWLRCQLISTAGSSRQENRADIDAQTVNPELMGPSAEQLAFAARQVQHALAGLEPADCTKRHQSLVSEWIQDAVILISDLVQPN